MRQFIFMLVGVVLFSCERNADPDIQFHVIDTDFSKGRLMFEQTIDLNDLVKFHGHLCDGLVVGAIAMDLTLKKLYPEGVIDRTNLRVVSKPSPCLTDVGAYLSGGRYQFNTFYVDTDFDGIYIVQRIDTEEAFSISMNAGVKPKAIDSLGGLAVKKELSACKIDSLKKMEDDFTDFLLSHEQPSNLFTVKKLKEFSWEPILRNDFLKTDVLNKGKDVCSD